MEDGAGQRTLLDIGRSGRLREHCRKRSQKNVRQQRTGNKDSGEWLERERERKREEMGVREEDRENGD